jgi:arginine decarboxylase
VVADLRAAQRAEAASFHMPGHKGGRGAPPLGAEVLGEAAYAADLSELSGFDYLHGADAGVAAGQERAARLLGAEKSWFLINGATVGNIAALNTVAHDGRQVLVARSSHRSVYAGLVTSGATPQYLAPAVNPTLDGLFGVHVGDVAEALEAHPDLVALHITSPNYYGFTAPVADLAELAHSRGLPLIVDEAHGTHFALHPSFPPSALSCGADLVVHSPHKTLGSLTQSSLLHLRGDRVDAFSVESQLQMLQSSSPSALLLVSLDVALDEMDRSGRSQWAGVLELTADLRGRLSQTEALWVYGPEVLDTPGIADYDPTKVVVDVSRMGITAFEAAAWLRREHHINPEFSDLRRMVFSVTLGDDQDTAELMVAALVDLGRRSQELERRSTSVSSLWPVQPPEMILTPRQAASHPARPVDLDKAVGRVSGEMIIPYPPGVPLLVPGERISADVVATMRQLNGAGCRVVGTSDPTQGTIRCILT